MAQIVFPGLRRDFVARLCVKINMAPMEKLTPVMEKLTPVMEKLTPVMEKLTPVMEKLHSAKTAKTKTRQEKTPRLAGFNLL